MDTLFISDMHLCQERPDKLELFQHFMRGPARQAKALYILGDLFENFWLGNDDRIEPSPVIISELKDYTRNGTPVYIIRGNRDLMLDEGIEELTGATLLPDMTVIDLDGEQVLITHGDILCTRDVSYQYYRKFMESRFIRWLFLNLPYRLRILLVRGLRPLMRKSVEHKQEDITDVDPNSVIRFMREFNVRELIHGHTHRPHIHELMIDNQPAKRIVLGDWYSDDFVLVCRDNERRLMPARDYIDSFE